MREGAYHSRRIAFRFSVVDGAMAVRFVCPSCQQPLEIDEQWAGQSVACPYCNRVVTAPAASTWPLNDQVPVASPAEINAELPPAQPNQGGTPPMPLASVTPAWAMALTLAGIGFLFVAVMTWGQAASPILVEKLGSPPTASAPHDAQIIYQRKFIDLVQSGVIPSPRISMAAVLIGLLCSLIGMVLGIKMIVQSQRRARGVVIAIVALLCIMCDGFWTLFLSLSMTSSLMK